MQNLVHLSYLLIKTSQFLVPYSKPALPYTNNSVSFLIQQEVEMQTLIQLWVWRCTLAKLNFSPLLLHSKLSALPSWMDISLLLSTPVPWSKLPCHLATRDLAINSVSTCLFSSYPCLPSSGSVGLDGSPYFFLEIPNRKEFYFVKTIPCSSCKVN